MAYLFRHQTAVIPGLGRVTYQWKWGRAAEVENDVNLDGKVDFRAEYHRWATNFSTDEPYSEAWESSKCDGRLDRHLIMGSNGRIGSLEIDTDQDGKYDESLHGEEARRYLEAHQRAEKCRWRSGPEPSEPDEVPGQ